MSTTAQEVVDLARRLRLPYLRQAADDVLATAKAQRWDPAEALRVLLEAEVEGRERSMVATHRRRAGFPKGKTFDAWDPGRSSITGATQRALRSLEWVGRHENLVVCGPSGTGKSHCWRPWAMPLSTLAARWPGSPSRTWVCSSAGTASTTPWPRRSPPCCVPTSSSTTSGCCR